MPRRFRQLWEWQPREVSPRWEPWLAAVYAVGFSRTVVLTALGEQTITLGPGLVDEHLGAFDRLPPQPALLSPGWLAAIVALATFGLSWRGVMAYRGPSRSLCRHLSVLFLLPNAVLTSQCCAGLGLTPLASVVSGHGFLFGIALVRHFTEWSDAAVARLPTLVRLPHPLPLVASMLCWSILPLFVLRSLPFRVGIGVSAKLFYSDRHQGRRPAI